MYEMFLGPLEQAKPWNTAGISGVHNFLNKYWRLFYKNEAYIVNNIKPDKKALKVLHETIKKVTTDIESFSFNTCISTFMICVNELNNLGCHSKEILSSLTILLSPFAPHISEELWNRLGNTGSIVNIPFPIFNEAFLIEDSKNYPISFNGKMRFTLSLSLSLDKDLIKKAVIQDSRTEEYLNGNTPKKWIIVPNKIINIVF
jgi:leucyl-tRNA synthetase